MLQHAHDSHTIQAFEKIVELQEQVKSQNQQLHADLTRMTSLINYRAGLLVWRSSSGRE